MRHIITIKKDGSFDLDPMYFSKTGTATRKLERLFGKQHQIQPYESQHGMDIAASLQVIVEDIMVKLATHALALTKNHNLCIAGAYALNTACNTRLRNRLVTTGQLYIQPAPGDAGGAIGAALMTWHHTLNNPRSFESQNQVSSMNMFSPFLGPSFSQEQIKATLIQQNAVAHDYLDPNNFTDTIATALSESKVVGLLTGKAEFGERALGNRCILADASNPKMLEILNLKIKFQESSRPLPGCILEEDLETLCDSKIKDPFMLYTQKLKQPQHAINGVQYPAITYANGTARLQTVTLKQCPQLHTVLKAYKRKTGHSVLINTPFNIRGEPMVLTPEDAYRCFMFTNMDILIMGHYILFKEEQIGHKQHKARRSQRSHREADHTLP